MNQAKKRLKFISECILILLAVSFVKSILEIFLTDVTIDDVSESLIITSKIIIGLLLTAIIFIPQLYIGVRGLKIAKNPNSSKAHIVWAVIFAGFAILSIISAIVGMVNTGDIAKNIFGIVNGGIDLAMYSCYIVFAKQVFDEV